MPRDLLTEVEDWRAGLMPWLDVPAPRKPGRHRKRRKTAPAAPRADGGNSDENGEGE